MMDPFEIQTFVNEELLHGEHTVWHGQPSPKSFSREALPMFLFGIPWTIFSVGWVAMSLFMTSGADSPIGIIFPLFGLPFVGIGIYLLASPFLKARKAGKTIYAVTDQRALIITLGYNSRNVTAYGPAEIQNIERTEKPDGSGDLYFRSDTSADSDGNAVSRKIGFLGIPEVRVVEMYIRDFLSHNKQ
jgi:hypothetical protein